MLYFCILLLLLSIFYSHNNCFRTRVNIKMSFTKNSPFNITKIKTMECAMCMRFLYYRLIRFQWLSLEYILRTAMKFEDGRLRWWRTTPHWGTRFKFETKKTANRLRHFAHIPHHYLVLPSQLGITRASLRHVGCHQLPLILWLINLIKLL